MTRTEQARRARTYADIKVGASSGDDNGMPQICAEINPLPVLGVEACGTGAGLWHDKPGREMAHFRLETTPYRYVLAGIALDPQIGFGFAEMQLGHDEPGFRFGSSRGKLDTSGPEGTLSLRATAPLPYHAEMVGELSASLAYFAGASDLASPQEKLQPSVAMAIGFGF